MRGEGIGQAEHGGELRAIEAGAKNPDRHGLALARHGAQALAFLRGQEIAHQLDDILRETVSAGLEVAPQGARGVHVGAGSPAETEIDAARKQGGQRAELLGDDQRRMVGQHDAAGADADGFGAAGNMGDDHGCGGAGNARHVVVLGQPVALVAQPLGMAGKIERVGQRLRCIAAFDDWRQVENGQFGHALVSTIFVSRTLASKAVRSGMMMPSRPCSVSARSAAVAISVCSVRPPR